MKHTIYTLAVTSHLHEVYTDVLAFSTLAAAQEKMKESYNGNLELLDATDNHYHFEIGEMYATLCDNNFEEIWVVWDIDEHEIEL